MPSRILVVDDALEIQTLVRRTLEHVNSVETVGSLEEAKLALRRGVYDLILLDMMLPDGDGVHFFEEYRSSLKNTPVIFLTGVGDVDKKVSAFRLGAEDYLVKPVDPKELLARVEARLTKGKNQSELSFGPLKVNLERYEVLLMADNKESPVDLTPHELKILIRLVQNRGRVLTRNQLIDEAWGVGIHIEERTVDKHVSSMRKKIGDASSFVKTVPGFGYMFSEKEGEAAHI